MTRQIGEIMRELRAMAKVANVALHVEAEPSRLRTVLDELEQCYTDTVAKVTQDAATNAAEQLRERATHWQALHGETAKAMVATVLKRGTISDEVLELGNIQLAVIEELRFMANVVETQPERDADWQTPGEAREAIFHAKVVAGSGAGREGFAFVEDDSELSRRARRALSEALKREEGSEPGPLCERVTELECRVCRLVWVEDDSERNQHTHECPRCGIYQSEERA